jgi:hypothetical protein
MKTLTLLRLAIPIALVLGVVACSDDDDFTGAAQSIARVSVDAPDSAASGVEFEVRITTENLGFSGLRDGRVDISLPLPLLVVSVSDSPGTNATFSNVLTGGRVTWDLGTLDSNNQSVLKIRGVGTLPAGQGSIRLTIEASMTGRGISPGEAVARDDMTLHP